MQTKTQFDDLRKLINNFVDGSSEKDFKVLKKHILHDFVDLNMLRKATSKRIKREE